LTFSYLFEKIEKKVTTEKIKRKDRIIRFKTGYKNWKEKLDKNILNIIASK